MRGGLHIVFAGMIVVVTLP